MSIELYPSLPDDCDVYSVRLQAVTKTAIPSELQVILLIVTPPWKGYKFTIS